MVREEVPGSPEGCSSLQQWWRRRVGNQPDEILSHCLDRQPTTCGDTNLVRFFLGGFVSVVELIINHNVKSNCSLLNVPNGVDEWQRT